MNVYPNPNDGRFAVAISNARESEIHIYNALGQFILPAEMTVSENIIEIDMGRQKGLFMVRIQTGNRFIFSKIYVR